MRAGDVVPNTPCLSGQFICDTAGHVPEWQNQVDPQGGYSYGQLCRTVRTAKGPHRKWSPRSASSTSASWPRCKAVGTICPPAPRIEQVDLRSLRVERAATSAKRYLALSLWHRLDFHRLLDDLLDLDTTQINDDLLYCGLDHLARHQDRLCSHLINRYRPWFGVRFEFFLYNVSSTYFEGACEQHPRPSAATHAANVWAINRFAREQPPRRR